MKSNFNPLVSIVIPVYNGSNYVREAIDSALAQTYKNIEIIVVNDGSTDNTEEIIKSYGNKLRYFKKENGGVSTALNLGIKKMKGEYFSWLSHDDVYYSNKIERQILELALLRQKNVVLYSNFCEINNRGEEIRKVILPSKSEKFMRVFLAVESSLYLQGCSLLIPKCAFKKSGLFDEDRPCTQDYKMWFTLANSFEFVLIKDELIKSRIHGEQDSYKKLNQKIEESENLRSNFILSLKKDEFYGYVDGNVDYYVLLCKQYYQYGYKFIPNALLKKIDEAFFDKDLNKRIIPKEINYFWFGNGKMSELNKKCIDSWRRFAPDYKIIKWDETNCNINENNYVREAYLAKKWAFVADYFRFKVLLNNGGFYCDTDLEFNGNINELRLCSFFAGFEKKEYVNVCFFGAVSGSSVVKKILKTYSHDSFIDTNGNLSANFTVPMRVTNLLTSEYSLCLNGFKQYLKDGIVIYPMNILTIDVNDGKNITKHYFENTWGERSAIPYTYILTRMFFLDLLSSEGVVYKHNLGFLSRVKKNENLYLDRIYSRGVIGHIIVRVYLKVKKIIVSLKR